MKYFLVLLFTLVVVSHSASVIERRDTVAESRSELSEESDDNALYDEEAARVYKGYNGGKRVWYG